MNYKVYPNPAHNFTIINLHDNKQGAVITIYNNKGEIILSEKIQAGILQQRIDLQKFNPGIYTVSCVSGSRQESNKLVIQ